MNPATTPFTICAWVYNTRTEAERLLTGDDQENIVHQLTGNGRVLLQVTTNMAGDTTTLASWASGFKYKVQAQCFQFGVWQHVAVTSNPTTLTHNFYVNGALVATVGPTSTAFESYTGGFRIGAHRILTNNAFWHV